jgi:ubiquinone/menaquinone biosynthesis C-methylase UbiE
LKIVRGLLRMIEPKTLLDIGAGTGRTLRHFQDTMPGISVRGIEPAGALIEQSVLQNGIPEGLIIQGTGEALPFEDETFDVVCSFAILHHVRRPEAVVREVMRVARRAVVIVDGNGFGPGRWLVRLLKLALYKAGLWGAVHFLKTGRKSYLLTPGDGLANSYSVYDSFDCLARWAGHLMLIPIEQHNAASWFQPLLTSSTVIVCVLKEME